MPLFVLGGPPCQGFSTAGNKRSLDDERNWLFRQYKAVIESVKPHGFVFENVTGVLNMEGGKVFELIREDLEGLVTGLRFWQLRSELYGIPQRRTAHRVARRSLRRSSDDVAGAGHAPA